MGAIPDHRPGHLAGHESTDAGYASTQLAVSDIVCGTLLILFAALSLSWRMAWARLLGAVSIFFIIIQPIVIGTWCTHCLIGAAAMVIQIPY